tara:strand:+ start:3067 stop:4179 length:1113 start_codon:yes stop_codon:yes gene_type:complete
MSIEIHPTIAAISPYTPGRLAEEIEREFGITQATKLASNENALGPSPKALSVLQDVTRTLNRYPDGNGNALKKALATKYGVAAERIILGNGSDELISLLVKVAMVPDDDAIIAAPSFSIYEKAVASVFGNATIVPLTNNRYDLSAMAKAITPRTRLLFVCNPNNPTGTIVNNEQLIPFLHQIPKHALVVVDEAYGEYATAPNYPDTIGLLSQGYPLVVLRTFSKIYGLAGLRIGYGIGSTDVIETMNKVRLPFNTNTLAQRAAVAALQDDEHINASQTMNLTGKELFYDVFTQLGLSFVHSEANFVYVDTKKNGKAVFEALLRFGVIVRHINGPMLRITVGLPHENEQFIAAFRSVMQAPSLSNMSRVTP